MNHNDLHAEIIRKESFLCVGLDTDTDKIPQHITGEQKQFEFNRAIIKATADKAVAFKLNLAFYEANGIEGWKSLSQTAHFIKSNYPGIFLIADAKRADIGNTAQKYAKALLGDMPFDAVTVSPYMGEDAVSPFLEYSGKWVIVLALTSNPGGKPLQYVSVDEHQKYYQYVLNTAKNWGTTENMMFVAGATRAEELEQVREIVPGHFLLIPGVGAQGGSLDLVARYGMNSRCGLLVNSSRGIIFAGNGDDFYAKASEKALAIQKNMQLLLKNYHIL